MFLFKDDTHIKRCKHCGYIIPVELNYHVQKKIKFIRSGRQLAFSKDISL